MNWFSIGFGLFFLFYGMYTGILRVKNPSSFTRVESMKKTYGEKTGLILHIVFYTIVPIVIGMFFIYVGVPSGEAK